MLDRYAVIGHPIQQSKSPWIHRLFAEATGESMAYDAIEGSLHAFADDVLNFQRQGGLGLNVTAPFKLQALALASDPLDRAQQAGATNALKFEGDRVVADNFDGLGLLHDLEKNLGWVVRGKRVLVLGAGGAARGVLMPLLHAKPHAVVVANRTHAKAQALAEQFAAQGPLAGCGLNDLAGESFDIVLNATSASLHGHQPDIATSIFAPNALAYDLAYGQGLTPFLKLAQQAGVTALSDGVGMLVEQAAEAFDWWRGVRPNTKPVIQRLSVPLR